MSPEWYAFIGGVTSLALFEVGVIALCLFIDDWRLGKALEATRPQLPKATARRVR